MADTSAQDVPLRVLEMVKIFLAASSRGERASLFLETRNGKFTTNYKSVETVAGVPATSNPCTKEKKTNPARDRRSKTRLEEFMAKKIMDKQLTASGVNTPSEQSKFVVELEPEQTTNKQAVTRLNSQIPQLHGAEVEDVT